MKRTRLFLSVGLLAAGLAVFAPCQSVWGQSDGGSAYYEEKIRALSSKVEELMQNQSDLVAAIKSLQRQCTRLAEELDTLRVKVNTPVPPPDLSGAASVESVRQLKAAVVALEERFIATEKDRDRDNKQILDQLDKLAKMTPAAPPPTKPKVPASTPKVETPVYSGTTYEWTVAEGETLSSIVKKVNASGGKTSVSAIQKANPTLKPNALRVGQKIIVPDIGNQ